MEFIARHKLTGNLMRVFSIKNGIARCVKIDENNQPIMRYLPPVYKAEPSTHVCRTYNLLPIADESTKHAQ